MENQPNRPLTVAQTANALGLSVHTVRAWISQRKLSHLKLGRAIRVLPIEIDRLLRISSVPAQDGLLGLPNSTTERIEDQEAEL